MANGNIPTSRLTHPWLMESLGAGLHRQPMKRTQFFPGYQGGGDDAYESYAKAIQLGYNPSQDFLSKLHKQRGPDWDESGGQDLRNTMKGEWQDYIDWVEGGGAPGEFETHYTDKPWIQSSTYGDTKIGNIFDPMSFAEAQFGQQKDWEGRIPPMDAFQSPTVLQMKKLGAAHYQPWVEGQRGTILDRLLGKTKTASGVGGSIAGYGGRDIARGEVKEGYRTGMEKIYGSVDEKRATALQDILDTLSPYEELERLT